MDVCHMQILSKKEQWSRALLRKWIRMAVPGSRRRRRILRGSVPSELFVLVDKQIVNKSAIKQLAKWQNDTECLEHQKMSN